MKLSLSVRRFKDDANGQPTSRTEIVHLDTESKDFAADLQNLVDLKVEEGAAPLRQELTAAEAEANSLRGSMVDEMLRVHKLAHKGEGEYDHEGERKYYMGLPAERLGVEYARTMKLNPPPPAQKSDAGTKPDEALTTGGGDASGSIKGTEDDWNRVERR
jgi:hypothetical protein